jgi:hypothetical protein
VSLVSFLAVAQPQGAPLPRAEPFVHRKLHEATAEETPWRFVGGRKCSRWVLGRPAPHAEEAACRVSAAPLRLPYQAT